MRLEQLGLKGACLIKSDRFEDSRGWFEEIWSKTKLKQIGLSPTFVQDNVSHSKHAGTLRGLHFQSPPMQQGKIVRVLRGAITDVLVDARRGSQTFGKHIKIDLCEADATAIWIPKGFLHGLVTREDDTLIHYKVTCPFSPAHDMSVRWNDPDLAIDWGTEKPIISEKDKTAANFFSCSVYF